MMVDIFEEKVLWHTFKLFIFVVVKEKFHHRLHALKNT